LCTRKAGRISSRSVRSRWCPYPQSPQQRQGVQIHRGWQKFRFLTDNELGFVHPGGLNSPQYLQFCQGADLLLHDAEYTPQEYNLLIEWGHSSYGDVLELAFKAGVKRLGLFHLNQERTDDEVDEMVAACHKIIAERNEPLDCFAVGADMTFAL
jgi:hypothetical protein